MGAWRLQAAFGHCRQVLGLHRGHHACPVLIEGGHPVPQSPGRGSDHAARPGWMPRGRRHHRHRRGPRARSRRLAPTGLRRRTDGPSTASPLAMASGTTLPKVSVRLGNRKTGRPTHSACRQVFAAAHAGEDGVRAAPLQDWHVRARRPPIPGMHRGIAFAHGLERVEQAHPGSSPARGGPHTDHHRCRIRRGTPVPRAAPRLRRAGSNKARVHAA
jgi:hypothetical protein